MVDPQGTLVMFGNSSNELTTFNVRDVYLDASVRFQVFELFFGGDPFGRDLASLVRLVADRQARSAARRRTAMGADTRGAGAVAEPEVAGKIAVTLGG